MVVGEESGIIKNAVAASWERCERQYNLVRETARPILRMQSSEVAPRLEEVVERTGGRRGIFRQLAEVAVASDQCLAIGDRDGVLVRIESKYNDGSEEKHYCLAVGSCWNERIAGTNGLAMAVSQNKAFTVRGSEHFFSKFHPFTCIAMPLFDAENQTIGALNITTIDRKNEAEYMFARQLLETGAKKIQKILFEQKFRDAMLVLVSPPEDSQLFPSGELVAVDEAGVILGATLNAHKLINMDKLAELTGKSFETLFEIDVRSLDTLPERVQSARTKVGTMLSFSAQQRRSGTYPVEGWRNTPKKMRPQSRRLRLPPTLRQLAIGSETLANVFEHALTRFQRALPFTIEGESGTGKSALIAALQAEAESSQSQPITIDCASLDNHEEDRSYIDELIKQARVIDAIDDTEHDSTTLVFDNVDELPGYAQAMLRRLLSALETTSNPLDDTGPVSAIRVIATCRFPLRNAVEQGRFRDDLYYMLGSARFELPPLRQRQRPEALARAVASDLAGSDVELTAEAEDAIKRHPWPGNVREMRSALQQSLLAGDRHRISLPDLCASSAFSASESAPSPGEGNQRKVLNAIYDEKTLLQDALTSANWNVSRAARNLGMGRTTIHRKMKQFGVARPNSPTVSE